MTPSRGPQRPSRLALRTRSETAPPRCANGATDDAADPRPGVTCAPSASLTPSAPFRSSDRHRLLDCPAHNVSPPRTNASASRRRRQASPAVADSPTPTTPALMRRSALMLGAEQRPSESVCGSFARLTHDPTTTRAPMRMPSVRPGTRCARAPRWRRRLALRRRSFRHVHVVSRRPRPASGLSLSHRLHGFRV